MANYNQKNRHAEKFKTPKARKKLCEEWCKHLSSGFSKESFPLCDPQTFRNYVVKYPNDFDTERISQAERKGRLFWERVGIDGTVGNLQKFCASGWVFNMKNRYGWRDKAEIYSPDTEHPLTSLGKRLFGDEVA